MKTSGCENWFSESTGLKRLWALATDLATPCRPLITLCVFLAVLALGGMARAAESSRLFDVPAGEATETLRLAARQGGLEIIFFAETVRGVHTPALRGELVPRTALDRLIAGTGLVLVDDLQDHTLTVHRQPLPAGDTAPRPSSPLPTMTKNNLVSTILSILTFASAARASDAPAGRIQGHVSNVVNGVYLNNALVTIVGSDRQTRTGEMGEFRFDNVSLGTVTLRATVSGFPPQSQIVNVAAGAPVTADFALGLAAPDKSTRDGVVQLDRFIVESQREMTGGAVAINERRAAANLKSVVAADEFGDSPEGNVAEFLKLVPGITVDYNAADARYVSVRGLPSFGTAVAYDGAPISSGTGSIGRETEFNQASLNNTARIEVIKSPLPDTRADAIGGSINIVSKSAFERSRRTFNYRTNLTANLSHWDGGEYYAFGRTPFSRGSNHKVLPGFDLNYINPISKNLGVSLSVMNSSVFTPEPLETSTWRPTHSGSSLAPASRPFLGTVVLQDGPKFIHRRSAGATVDWRATPLDVFSLGVQVNWQRAVIDTDGHTFNVIGARSAAPTAYDPTFVQGASGAGTINNALATFDKIAPSYTVLLRHRHAGSVWAVESGASFSESWSRVESERDNVIKSLNLSATGLTVRYDGISNSIPRAITAQTASGAAFDWGNLGNFGLTSATTGNAEENRFNMASARVSAARDFGRSLRLKTGLDWRREARDRVNPTVTYTFVGPDRIANSADDSVSRYDLVSESWSQVSLPFGLGRPQRPAPDKAYNLFREHPEYWTANEVTKISSRATNSQKITEHVLAGYLRADGSFFSYRLKLAGGVRYEHTFDEGWGVLNDLSRTYLRDSNGQIVRSPTGAPLRVTTDPVELARLQYTERGSHAKKNYGNLYPSVGATYHLTEKLLTRATFATTITRPQLSNIIPSITATDPTVTTSVPTITVTNAGLRPWFSKSYDLGLEYYFDKPGVVSVGVFRKDIRDFFGSVRTSVTPEQLAEWGFDQSFANYDVVTTENIGSARVSGVEFEYRQTVPYLPARFGNLLVNFNTTSLHIEGGSANSIRGPALSGSGFTPLTMNYGITYSTSRLTARANCSVRGRARSTEITGTNVDPATFTFAHPRRSLDVNVELRISRWLSLFGNIRNVTAIAWRSETYAPTTPAYARNTRWVEYGPNALFGVKGSF